MAFSDEPSRWAEAETAPASGAIANHHVIVVADANGAGKSTSAPCFLRDTLEVQEFVEADTLASGLSAFSPESVAIAAGRIMLERIRELAVERADFAFVWEVTTCRLTLSAEDTTRG